MASSTVTPPNPAGERAAAPAEPVPAPRRSGRLWAAVSLAVAAAVTLIAWRTGDWWIESEWPGFERNLTVARILLFGLVAGAVWAAPRALRRTSRVARIVFGAWAAYLGLWLMVTWPGLLMTDSVDVVFNARRGIVYEWFSYLHPLLHMAVMDVVPQIWMMVGVQAAATAALMAYASAALWERRPSWWPIIAMNVVAALSAPLVVTTLLASRDSLFGVAHVFLALYVARAVVIRRSLSRRGFAGVVALVAILSVYRGDGIALVLAVPLVLLVGLRPPRRTVLRGAAALAGALLVVHVALPAALSIREQPNQYDLSLRMNPLGAVLQSPDFYASRGKADLEALGRVIDVEAVKRVQVPTEIPAYWNGNWNRAASDEDHAAFRAAADRLLRDNLSIVLGNRVRNFGAATGLAPDGFRGTERGTAETRHDWIEDREGLEGEPPFAGLFATASHELAQTAQFRGLEPAGSALHWNLLPWLALLVVPLLAFRRFALEAAFSLVILARVPLVFLAAPAAQHKYYFSVLLGGLVVLGLLLTRVRRGAPA